MKSLSSTISSQLISVLILPVSAVISLYSKEILLLWTRDPMTAGHTHSMVSILLVGATLNSLMFVPYALQLASGWTRLGFSGNLVSLLVLVPLTVCLAKLYGAVGAASAWAILGCGYLFIVIPIMHSRLLPEEKMALVS